MSDLSLLSGVKRKSDLGAAGQLLTRSGHAMRRLGQVNAAGRPYAAPVKAENPVRYCQTIKKKTK
jgi:hypothetical protein